MALPQVVSQYISKNHLRKLIGVQKVLNFTCLTMKFHNRHHATIQVCIYFLYTCAKSNDASRQQHQHKKCKKKTLQKTYKTLLHFSNLDQLSANVIQLFLKLHAHQGFFTIICMRLPVELYTVVVKTSEKPVFILLHGSFEKIYTISS